MKRIITITLAAFAITALTLTVASAQCCGGQSCALATNAKKTVSAICPVMGNKIPDVSKAAGKSVYKGKTYYFCCPACKPQFDRNPEKYVGKSKPQK